jgi:hypothetical protein
MAEVKSCPACHAALPADAPEGPCGRCLAQQSQDSAATGPALQQETLLFASADSPSALSLADLAAHLPHLEILGLLGQGGMGVVCKARQTQLDRIVALKILPFEACRDPSFAARFQREAAVLARLSHPHIVSFHDFGESPGLYYFLMEFVEGGNLRQLLLHGPCPPRQALPILVQVCDALAYAHERGVIHRDIKPENILRDHRGGVKIADFGLAKLLGRGVGDRSLTASQQVMGTVHYMAPEQVETPQRVDHRADIYSAGVVLYELLTGHLPLGRFAPPSQEAATDPRLDEVVLRALEREPERRYQSSREMKLALEDVTREPPARPPALPAGPPPVPAVAPPVRDAAPPAGIVPPGPPPAARAEIPLAQVDSLDEPLDALPAVDRSAELLPPWLVRRVVRGDERVSWVWGPRRSPAWEPYVTHPALFLVALAVAAAVLAAGKGLVEKWSDMPVPVVVIAAVIVFGSVFVLALANAHFTRLVVTSSHLTILQGYEICRRWGLKDLPPSLLRYRMQAGGQRRQTVDLDAVKSMFGGGAGHFAEAKTILAFGKQLGAIKGRDGDRS